MAWKTKKWISVGIKSKIFIQVYSWWQGNQRKEPKKKKVHSIATHSMADETKPNKIQRESPNDEEMFARKENMALDSITRRFIIRFFYLEPLRRRIEFPIAIEQLQSSQR